MRICQAGGQSTDMQTPEIQKPNSICSDNKSVVPRLATGQNSQVLLRLRPAICFKGSMFAPITTPKVDLGSCRQHILKFSWCLKAVGCRFVVKRFNELAVMRSCAQSLDSCNKNSQVTTFHWMKALRWIGSTRCWRLEIGHLWTC